MSDVQEIGEQRRQALGIDGTMGDAQDVPHTFDDADRAVDYCVVCGLSRTYRMHRDALDGCPPDRQRHFMLPGTHEFPRTPECRCGAVWYRDADACSRQLAREAER